MTGSVFQAVVSGWALAMVRVLVWGTLVLLAAGVADRAIGARAPRARSWVWRLAWIQLALLLVPGSGRLVLPEPLRPPQNWEVALPEPLPAAASTHPDLSTRAEGTVTISGTAFAGLPGAPGESGGESREPRRAAASPLSLWPAGLFSVWLVWTLTGIALLSRRRTQALRWIDEARGTTDSEFTSWAERWREDLGIRCRTTWSRWMSRRLQIRVHPAVGSPRVAGLWQPTILLPGGGTIPENEESARAVLDHEWGHVARGDLVWRWVRGWCRAALFFHPLVAWADRRTTLAEEMACDRLAMDAGALSAAGYGRMLVRWAEAERLQTSGAVGLAASMSRQAAGLLERLQGLAVSGGRLSRRRLVLLVLGLASVGLLGWVTTGGRRDIRQFDGRFPVLGFHVSRGQGHSLQMRRETLELFGLHLTRLQVVGHTGLTTFQPGLPSRVADVLSRLGLRPDLYTTESFASFSDGQDGYALFVRFRLGPSPDVESPDRLRAELVDEAGERVPLMNAGDLLNSLPGSEDVFRVWTLSPAPRTSGRFDLSLILQDEDKEVARLRLGRLGGTP